MTIIYKPKVLIKVNSSSSGETKAVREPTEPPPPITPPEPMEPIIQAVLKPQHTPPAKEPVYFAINRPYFLQNMLLNITNGYSRTMLKNKHLPATKERYLQCYWQDVKEIAAEWNITIEDLKAFTQN